jgi:hypothetical protein
MNERKRKFVVRLTAIIMALLMVGGSAYAALSFIFA